MNLLLEVLHASCGESESNTDGKKKLFYILLLRVFEQHVDSFQYLSEKEKQRTTIQYMTSKLSCNQHNVPVFAVFQPDKVLTRQLYELNFEHTVVQSDANKVQKSSPKVL